MQYALYTGSVLRTSGHGNIQYIHPDEQKRLLTVMDCLTDNTVGARLGKLVDKCFDEKLYF